jgi:hypothetical protein
MIEKNYITIDNLFNAVMSSTMTGSKIATGKWVPAMNAASRFQQCDKSH